jgi:hypothetical protein
LFSGEELELWLLKTVMGGFFSGYLGKDGKRISETQTIMNEWIECAFRTGFLIPPSGMYVLMRADNHVAHRDNIDFQSLSEDTDRRVVGCRLTFMGLVITFFLDPAMSNREAFTVDHAFQPAYLTYRNKRREHFIVLTWPKQERQLGVRYDTSGSVRSII